MGGITNPYLKKTQWDWPIDPVGLRYTLSKVYDRYQCPIMITENGIGCVDKLEADGTVHDPYRIAVFKSTYTRDRKAIDDGVDLIGYMAGSIDLLSMSTGERKKDMDLFMWTEMMMEQEIMHVIEKTHFTGIKR